MRKRWTNLRVKLPVFIFITQAIFLGLFATFVTYDDQANAIFQTNRTNPMDNTVYKDYPFFIDIQVMIFLGFGHSFVSRALGAWFFF